MSEKECLSANWYQVGFHDGRNGEYVTWLDRITEDCAKAKVVPDQERYFAGREAGLRDYCRPENGFRLGRDGGYFHAVCPKESAVAFENSYRAGSRIHEAHELVERIEKDLAQLKDKHAKAKTEQERRHIHREIEESESHLRQARDALFHLEVSEKPF